MDNLLSFLLIVYLMVAAAILAKDKIAKIVGNYQRSAISSAFKMDEKNTFTYGRSQQAYSDNFSRDSDRDGLTDDLDTQPFDNKRY